MRRGLRCSSGWRPSALCCVSRGVASGPHHRQRAPRHFGGSMLWAHGHGSSTGKPHSYGWHASHYRLRSKPSRAPGCGPGASSRVRPTGEEKSPEDSRSGAWPSAPTPVYRPRATWGRLGGRRPGHRQLAGRGAASVIHGDLKGGNIYAEAPAASLTGSGAAGAATSTMWSIT